MEEGMTASEKELPVPGEVFRVEGRTAFLISPAQPASGQPTPWVWYAPTLAGLPGPEEKWMFERFLDAGMGVAGIDVGESYGSPRGEMILRVVEGQGHNMWSGWFQCRELVEFVIASSSEQP